LILKHLIINLLLILFVLNFAQAQVTGLFERFRQEKKITNFIVNDKGMPTFIKGNLTPKGLKSISTGQVSNNANEQTFLFFEENRELFQMVDPRKELNIARIDTDNLGMTHVKLKQMWQGVEVYGSEMIAHFTPTGELSILNGEFLAGIDVPVLPKITAQEADSIVLSKTESIGEKPVLTKTQLVIYQYNAEFYLAWLIELSVHNPAGRWDYFINSKNGTEIYKANRIMNGQPEITGSQGNKPLLRLEIDSDKGVKVFDAESGVLKNQFLKPVTNDTTSGLIQSENVSIGATTYSNLVLYSGTGAINTYNYNTTSHQLDITNSVQNIGSETAGSFRTGWYLSTKKPINKTDYLVTTSNTVSLSPGSYANVSGSIDLNNVIGLPKGTYYIGIIFDDQSEVIETNELDNYRSFTPSIDFGVPPTINLFIYKSTGSNNTYSYNDTNHLLDVNSSIQNDGSGLAGSFRTGWYLSTNTTITTSDQLLAISNSSSLASMKYSNISQSINLDDITGLTSGTYYIGVIIDDQSQLTESNEADNAFFYPQSIYFTSAKGADSIGTGIGVMGDTKSHIDSYGFTGSFDLLDRTRRVNNNPHNHNGLMRSEQSIETRLYPDTTPLNDADNIWNNSLQAAAIDAHVYAGLVYDYFRTQFDRNGYDNLGTGMLSIVDDTTGSNNANWNGSEVTFYKVSSGYRSMAGAIDIVAHEWGHALTESESNLIYEKEPGALNESFSDMIGIAVGFGTGIDPDWQQGENFYNNNRAIRDLSNPHLCNQPDTYLSDHYWVDVLNCTPSETNDYCGVHANSGVPNKMFYLLSQGGTFNGITVTGIGISNAIKIMYRANVNYWTVRTDFLNAKQGCVSAANDLDITGNWAIQVRNAWEAVNVGVPLSIPVAIAATNITSSSFSANWNKSARATKYFVDVSLNSSFSSFVTGFSNKEVANTTLPVTGLTPETTYYYRVRASDDLGSSSNSNTINLKTLSNPCMLSVIPLIQNISYSSAGSTSFTLTSTCNWTVESDQTWCTVIPSGTGDGTIVATYTENISSSLRTAILTITVPGASGSPQTVKVIQAGCTLPADAGTITGTSTVCQGQSSVVYTVTTIANATIYVWTLPTGTTGSSTTNSIIVNYVASAISGNITVKGHNTCGDGAVSTLAITLNSVPVANAGIDLSVNEGVTVTLDGTASSDADGNVLTYKWSAPAGITLSSESALKPTFIAPEVMKDTAFTFSLVVNDGLIDSPVDQVVIQVKNVISLQEIPLIAGWNIISANVVPANVNLKDIFQPFIDSGNLKKVMDEAGKTIENRGFFGGWVNNIGNLTVTEGYKVNMTAAATLSLEGTLVPLPLDIPLLAGWNIISYPCATAQDGRALVQSLIETGKLIKVMDESGKTIENFGIFGGWKNNIGNFEPGKGYKVKVATDCKLTIPAVATKAAAYVPEIKASTHFTKVFDGNGIDHMNVSLVDLQTSGLQPDDEIGIFDGKYCVGSATIGIEQLRSGSISIPASANEGSGNLVNGFSIGNQISLKLYRGNQSYDLALEMLLGTQSFEKNGSVFLKVSANDLPVVQLDNEPDQFRCYPNPFKDELTVEIRKAKESNVEVAVYNLLGQKIKNLYKGSNKGELMLKWNGANDSGHKVVIGIYLVKMNGQAIKVVYKY